MAMMIDGTSVATQMAGVAAAGGGLIEVPTGTWQGFFELACSNVWFKGRQSRSSILQFLTGGGPENYLIRAVAGTWRRQIRFTDLTIDAVGAQFGVNIAGYAACDVLFERCRFINFTGGFGFIGNESCLPRFVECEFLSPGNAAGVAVALGTGLQGAWFERCRFGWSHNGILVDSGVDALSIPGSKLFAEGCTFRGDYWGTRAYPDANATGSGATVTYTGAGDVQLNDSARNFAVIPYNGLRQVRVMPVQATGTTTNVGQLYLRDNTKNFNALADLQYGDIVRTATAWTMVIGPNPLDNTELFIDGWRDLTTYDDVAPPAIGTAYTLYAVVLGRTVTVNPTQIITNRWRRLDGSTVTVIPDGTRYEILVDNDAGQVHVEGGFEAAMFLNCESHGGDADNFTLRGPNSQLIGCKASYSRDAGCTIQGAGSRVLGGAFVSCGSSGIFVPEMVGGGPVQGVEIAHTSIFNSGCEYDVSNINSEIGLYAAQECVIHGNRLVRGTNPRGFYGVRFAGDAVNGYSINNQIYDNRIYDHVTGAWLIEPGGNEPNHRWNNDIR